MKYLFTAFLVPCFLLTLAQPGLQSIYVETYYVCSPDDGKGQISSGPIDKGSVVYRIYADLEPGYRFQAAFGSPDHALEITSDKPFFNHNHSGSVQPNIIPERDLAKNITLLDSWLSVGAATENHLGIPRKYDMVVQDSHLRFQSGFLTNVVKTDEKDTGPLTLPLSQCDGLVRSQVVPPPTFYMTDSVTWALSSVTRSNRVYIDNGAWACMGKGSVGADSTSGNHVLIAQLTTAGILQYKLNIMIGTPEGKSLRYVHSNPVDGEELHVALAGTFSYKANGKRRHGKRTKSKRK